MILNGVRAGVALTGLVAIAATAGCGGSAGSGDGSGAAIVATTTIWADVTSRAACGEEVVAVIPSGADPHSFEPSLRDRERLEHAGAVIANGSGLEESLTDLLDTVAAGGVPIVEITPHVDRIDDDPHVWQDPRRVIDALAVIATALIDAGRDPAEIGRCTDSYRAELTALDSEIAELLSGIPVERRLLVTNHDAFGYFAERYGFEIIGTVIPSSSSLGESSAGQLAELAELIEEHDVPAIFTERLGSAADAEALARRLGVEIVELDSDALAEDGPGSTYTGLVRANAEAIAAALG